MQTVAEGFTAEERDSTRSIAESLLVSWKKETNLAAVTFTIGVSLIGGSDLIGINAGAIGSPSNYYYFDETDYLMSLSWERGLNMPTGGLTKAQGEALLDNSSNRFTPRYMGGDGELFTSSYLTRRPFIINSGFHYAGIDQTIPQLTGITTKPLEIDQRSRRARLSGADYIDFFQNRYLDQTTIYTGQFTDTILESLMVQSGMSTSQYSLDQGINIVGFGLFPKGSRFSDIIGELVEAEKGHFYQDEQGKFRFENRQHWDSSPYTDVQKIILTSQVINAESPNTDHLINVVEVKGKEWKKQPTQTIFKLALPIEIKAGEDYEFFASFDDPVLELSSQIFIEANTSDQGTGTDITSSIAEKSRDVFANAAKFVFSNNGTRDGYITQFILYGRIAKNTSDIYARLQTDSSVTAYEERPLVIENEFIQNQSWAETYAQMVLDQFSQPENLQKITVRAMPSLQLGDLISWQGRYWRVFNIRSQIDPSVGYTQELTLLQRTIISYFRIGISTIGGDDKIAP